VNTHDGRHVGWPGCVNFRDAGGYETVHGSALPRGRIYRSGHLAGIEAATAGRIQVELGLRTIVDLRTSMERRVFRCDALAALAQWHMPLFESVPLEWEGPMAPTARAIAARYEEILAVGAATVGLLVRRLVRPEAYPVLIHCAAGRDRTGIVVALLHSLLGVDRRDVAADYALSAGQVIGDGAPAEPETMNLLLASIDRRYGSVRGFFLAQGISEEDLLLFETAVRSEPQPVSR
jgi:protein-tyrosine phosphatase